MKYQKADLTADVVGSYDQTKTTTQGRITQKTISSTTVLGPPLNDFIDVFTDSTGLLTPAATFLSANGRQFTLGLISTGNAYLSLHNVNLTTGARSYVGMIRLSFGNTAATTHTIRSFKVLDSGTSGWRLFVAAAGSVLINGGVYCANNIALSDFVTFAFPIIPFATGSNQKAMYLLQDPSFIGVNQLNVAAAGMVLDSANDRIYCHNGVSATHQYYVYSTTATLDCPLSTGLVIDAATDTVTQVGHTYLANDPVFLTNLSGGAGLTNNTNYFVRNPTATTYQLSATSGGAIINITTNGTVDIARSFGTTSSAWVHKTGNLPALTGTLVLTDSEDYAVPGHTANSGFPCVFLATGTNLYLGRISDLTSGAVTWPSLVTSNIFGTPNQITGPTLATATWSTALDQAVYITNAAVLVMKQVVNNSITKVFGRLSNIYRETMPASNTVGLGFVTAIAIDIESGWLSVAANTTGQRGIYIADLRSDEIFDYSYIVTKVLNTPSSEYRFIASLQQLVGDSSNIKVYYRTSGFGSVTGGWVAINYLADISAVASAAQIQFKITFDTLKLGSSIPAQVNDLILGYEDIGSISDNWEFSDDFSDNTSPSRTAFRLKVAYTSSVPTLYYRAYDLTNALLINNNTVTNAANFEYSTTNGVSWLPLGTIPNTVGTLIRYTFTSPPGVDIRPGLRES